MDVQYKDIFVKVMVPSLIGTNIPFAKPGKVVSTHLYYLPTCTVITGAADEDEARFPPTPI